MSIQPGTFDQILPVNFSTAHSLNTLQWVGEEGQVNWTVSLEHFQSFTFGA